MFRQLLVPLDGSSLAEQALGPASAIARQSEARLDLVLVQRPLETRDQGIAPLPEDDSDVQEAYLKTIAGEISKGWGVTASHGVLKGDVVRTITTRAQELKADLIVLTSHGRTGFSRVWLGSVADSLIRSAAVPLLLLRAQSRKADRSTAHTLYRRILVLLDGSKESEAILPAATSIAACSNAQLVLLRVVEPLPLAKADISMPFGLPNSGVPSVLALVRDEQATKESRAVALREVLEIAAAIRKSGRLEVETHVLVSDQIASAIVDFAETRPADVIALCTRGRGASRLIVGSIADKVLRSTHLPVLVCRPA